MYELLCHEYGATSRSYETIKLGAPDAPIAYLEDTRRD